MKVFFRKRDEMLKLIKELERKLTEHDEFLDAYLYTSRTRCGRLTCKCMKTDYRHENSCVSYTEEGCSRTRTVGVDEIDRVHDFTSSYRTLRKLRTRLISNHKEFVNSIDSEVNKRLRKGRRKVSFAKQKGTDDE
jgi:hypothetical protein